MLHLVIKRFFATIVFLCFSCHAVNAHPSFENVVSAAKPSIVIVYANKKKRLFGSSDNEKVLGEYADFFAEEIKEIPDRRRGSGFVISADGLIITAAHVVNKSSKVVIELTNGKKHRAELLFYDPKSDVALLKAEGIKSAGLSPLRLQRSLPEEGAALLALSGSLGLPVSSSQGIVSALNVKLPGKRKIGLIQTDAAINPGSSGGALLNTDGRVVGLISQIYTSTGSFSGTAFAVPAGHILDLLTQWKIGLDDLSSDDSETYQ